MTQIFLPVQIERTSASQVSPKPSECLLPDYRFLFMKMKPRKANLDANMTPKALRQREKKILYMYKTWKTRFNDGEWKQISQGDLVLHYRSKQL